MAVSKVKLLCSSSKFQRLLCPRNYCLRRAQLEKFISNRYCSSENKSDAVLEEKSKIVLPSETQVKKNLQPIPKQNRKLSVIDEKDRPLVEKLKSGDEYYPYEGPYDKVKSMTIDNFKVAGSLAVKFSTGIKLSPLDKPFYPTQTDIVIIGCNAIGLSIAFAMKEKFPDTPNIMVIDKDENFPPRSTNIGQSMLTQQFFTDEEEIAMNKYAAEFLNSFPRLTEVYEHPRFKMPYEPLGTLCLADESNAEKLLHKNEILKGHDIYNKILDIKTLKRKFPWLNLDKILFGSLGMTHEGMYDPWSFFHGLKCKAVNLGVQFLTAEVLDIGFDDGSTVPRRIICKLQNGNYHPIQFAILILACGIESLNLVDILNKSDFGPLKIKLPLEERMRYEYCFHNPNGPGLNTPIVIEPDGTYFRREYLGNNYIAGVPSVPHGEEEELGPYSVFINKIKPFLAKRVPQFKEIDLVKGWIDSYDFCISNNVGIIGPHPNDVGIMFALGFSHLGLQHAPAVGRAIMEYIAYDEYKSIDMTKYQIENLWRKQHLEAEKKKEELIESNQRIAITD